MKIEIIEGKQFRSMKWWIVLADGALYDGACATRKDAERVANHLLKTYGGKIYVR